MSLFWLEPSINQAPSVKEGKETEFLAFSLVTQGSFIVTSNLSNTERKGALLERIKKKKSLLKIYKGNNLKMYYRNFTT